MWRVQAGSARLMHLQIFALSKPPMRKPGSVQSRRKRSAEAILAIGVALLAALAGGAAGASALRPFTVVGDAIPVSLTGNAGDPTHGRAIVLDRRLGACLLCHTGPFPEERFQGTL